MPQQQRDAEPVVGTSGAGRELDLSGQRVRDLVREGRLIPALVTAEGYHYFRVSDLQAFKRERQARKQKAAAR
jgi:hypothetical protein